MKKGIRRLIILIIVMVLLGFIIKMVLEVYNIPDPNKEIKKEIDNFEPTITQGIYGVAIECHGSAMPPSQGELRLSTANIKIENTNTKEIIEASTKTDGKYEIELEEGHYYMYVTNLDLNVLDLKVREIYIYKDTLKKANLPMKSCPV